MVLAYQGSVAFDGIVKQGLVIVDVRETMVSTKLVKMDQDARWRASKDLGNVQKPVILVLVG